MRNIYILLLFVLLFGFVGMKEASGQCEYCQYPSYCNTISFPVTCNGQTFDVEAVVCYNCDNNRAIYIQVLELSYPAPFEQEACIDAMWDVLWINIRSMAFALCGYVDCSNPVTIYRTIPLCGEFIYEGPPGHEFIRKRFHPGDCNLRCLVELRVCYNYNTGTFDEQVVAREPLGSCSIDARYPGWIQPGTEPFRIFCAQLWSTRYCPW